MNINNIKRNLNNPVIPVAPMVPLAPLAPMVPLASKPIDIPKIRYVNKMFEEPEEEEEEKPPNSVVWNDLNEVEPMSILHKPINTVINSLGLADPRYDWRDKTSKGKHSHRNFTQYLKENL